MINVDLRLLDLIPEIGADAFTILCVICNGWEDSTEEEGFYLDWLQVTTDLSRIEIEQALQRLRVLGFISVSTGTKARESGAYTMTIFYIKILSDLIQASLLKREGK